MAMTLATILQIIIGLGLLNVWLLRSGKATAYRGGEARTLREEFQAYGLPSPVFYAVGALKISAGILLLVGLWVPEVVLPSAAVVAFLMVGALVMHVKVGDPPVRSAPALLMLIMSGSLCALVGL
jgi:uncharacterized membrane protein YphA (DoxX/SURF4 family)